MPRVAHLWRIVWVDLGKTSNSDKLRSQGLECIASGIVHQRSSRIGRCLPRCGGDVQMSRLKVECGEDQLLLLLLAGVAAPL